MKLCKHDYQIVKTRLDVDYFGNIILKEIYVCKKCGKKKIKKFW